MRRKDGGELDALITSSVWQDGESNETVIKASFAM